MPIYNYKKHSEIPAYMRDYLLSVSNSGNIEDVSLEDINGFLNGLEEWEREVQLTEPVRRMNRKILN
jgi:hypothetical protein